MFRLALFVAGISTAVAAWTVVLDRKKATRRIDIREAAAKLQQAWADHHTVA